MNPPRHAEALLRAFLVDGPDSHDGILGDMAEGWSERATTRGAGAADRWYWGQAIRSMPPLVMLWCETVGPRRVTAAAVVAIVARILMLLVQYAAIALVAGLTSGNRNPVEAIVVAIGCVGAAATCGFAVRRFGGPDSAATIGALCAATLLVHVVSPRLIQEALPVWLYWVSSAPLSAIAVVVGATRGGARTA